MRSNLTRVFAWLALAVLTCPFGVYGQAGSGELTGEVRDPAGALVAGARITLTDTATNQNYLSLSSESGVFTLAGQKPGTYRIAVEARGFKRFVRNNVTVTTGERVRVDVELAVGEITDSVTVHGDVELLRKDSATISQVVDVKTIPALPLNGRTFVGLVGLAPGIALPPGSALPRLSGSRPRTNEYLYDGIGVLQPEPGQVAFFPIIDAIREFNVQTNDAPAEFGRFNGGVVNLTTKSGTNDFHGTLFEFLRNEAVNARNRFAPATTTNPKTPEFRRNQFGFVAGGPVIRNKTFFFADYQGTRQLIGRVVTSTVPTVAERGGDFSAILGKPLYRTSAGTVTTDPTTNGTANTPILVTDTNGNSIQARQNMLFRPTDHVAYAGNKIPTSSFDTVAASLLDHYPQPTSSGLANNFRRVGNEPDSQDQFDVRIDHRFSSNDQVFGRYSYAKDFTEPVTALPDGSGTVSGGAARGPQNTLAQAIAGNYVHAQLAAWVRAFGRRGPQARR
jgi:hypothetical protein